MYILVLLKQILKGLKKKRVKHGPNEEGDGMVTLQRREDVT